MEKNSSPSHPARIGALTPGPWLLAAAGVLLFHAAWYWQGDEARYWLPGLGLGIVLVSWVGWRILPVLALDLLVVRWLNRGDIGLPIVVADAVLYSLQIGLSWWLYHQVARGSRWLDDPRSATLFLILVPGGVAAATAVVQAIYRSEPNAISMVAAQYWLSRMVGILIVTPILLIVGTPILMRWRLVDIELPPAFFGERDGASRLGDRIETTGLTFATCVLAVLLLWTHLRDNDTRWMLWALCLVLVVWTCIRQGLAGGCFSAGVTSVVVLAVAQMLDAPPRLVASIQGNVLAFCSSALLVGVSASWIRANETRYRHVVGRIPFVVYSARLPQGIPGFVAADPAAPRRDTKVDINVGPLISKLASVMLVSPAARQIFGCAPESLIGPFASWLGQIVPEDRELVIASLAQLCLQNQPVICEYRLLPVIEPADAAIQQTKSRFEIPPAERWVRDTLTPHFSDEGLVNGWEGLVEDITQQRALSQNLRKMTNMLQALVTNLPTGVYFVHGVQGYPLLVNARARQLLGQREDPSAGLANLSRVFRLRRPDGTEYPWEELPVSKALRQGVACRANDIVVHSPDGRKIPLITWAAPIDLHNTGALDAAVWVLDDWTAMQQAEQALRDSELRLRAIIETMGEGVIVQDHLGIIVDCNVAACTILEIAREKLFGQRGLVPRIDCLKEDGSIFPREEQPDRVAARTHQPARGVIVGVPIGATRCVRWLLVNAMPLPAGPGQATQKARVVTTFADITQQMEIQDSLRHTRDRYQNLLESLPLMLVQRDPAFKITYLNPAATQLTGHSTDEFMQPGFCESIIHADDLPLYQAAAQAVGQGKSMRVEMRLRVKDSSWRSVMAFFDPNVHQGAVVGSTSLVVDITTQRRLEEELQESQRLELIGRLASGTVHDFNNLLMVVMSLAGMAKNALTKEHPAWQFVSGIEDAGEQAAHLAGQILTFGKQRPRESEPVDLNNVITQTLKLAQSVVSGDIKVITDLDPQLPTVLGDENQFKQIVMNLCLNARDAMIAGGTLTICTDQGPPPNADGKAWVHLAIEDTGCGMPEEVRLHVFEPFFSTKERGTGLGLAVVQRIIKESGGLVSVHSKPGEGTRFDIWLPRGE